MPIKSWLRRKAYVAPPTQPLATLVGGASDALSISQLLIRIRTIGPDGNDGTRIMLNVTERS